MCAVTLSEVGDENASSAAVRTNIRRLMVDDHESHDGSAVGDPMQDHYQIHPVSDDKDVDAELVDIPEEEHEELNNSTVSQVALTQPAISRPYDHLAHYSTLNLDTMNVDWSFGQGGSEDDPTHNFEIGQQFDNKEAVMTIRSGCQWNIRIAYRQKQEKWEIRRYNGPHSCMQTTLGQDHRRLDLKVVAEHVFSMVKTDPTINIRVLQRTVKNHFDYKTSYKKF
ncbi:hypothetical protein Ahy_B05g073807 [Arachis hypogaea]|uniref:Transposase MuDR plant domain-containing protein n=1 Tax=Arachis hypogaea TaxID=3818 RepID=A0A444YX17_ARAHY|nr:hypothetical protein Ahy_B05g073807 [Arachis hypogaea]